MDPHGTWAAKTYKKKLKMRRKAKLLSSPVRPPFAGKREESSKTTFFFFKLQKIKMSRCVEARRDWPPPGPRLGGPPKLPCLPADLFFNFFVKNRFQSIMHKAQGKLDWGRLWDRVLAAPKNCAAVLKLFFWSFHKFFPSPYFNDFRGLQNWLFGQRNV